MERRNGQAFGLVAFDSFTDTLAHFARRFIGEGNRGNVPGFTFFM